MTNNELNDKVLEIYRDYWNRLPGIYRFSGKKTVVWICLMVGSVLSATFFWYLFSAMGAFGGYEVDPASVDPHVHFKTADNLSLNLFILFMSFFSLLVGAVLLFILLRARKLEKKIYADASRHAAHLSEKEREKEFLERFELKKQADEEIEEMHRNMKAEFCPKCGLLLIPGNNICPSCGADASEKE